MKLKTILLLGLFLGGSQIALAAGPTVDFSPATHLLAISGQCSGSEVLVLLRRKNDNSIWGSSDPKCVGGHFKYEIKLDDPKISATDLAVEIKDDSYAGPASSNTTGKTGIQSMALDYTPQIVGTPLLSAAPVSAPAAVEPDLPTPSVWESFVATLSNWAETFNSGMQEFMSVSARAVKTVVLAAENIFVRVFEIAPDGKIIVPDGKDQLSGRGLLRAGTSGVFIPNIQIEEGSQIILTPTTLSALPLTVLRKDPGRGFEVGISGNADSDIAFDWLVVSRYRTGSDSPSVSAGSFVPAPTPAPSPSAGTAPIISAGATEPAPVSNPDPAPSIESPPAEPAPPTADISPPAADSNLVSDPAPSPDIQPISNEPTPTPTPTQTPETKTTPEP